MVKTTADYLSERMYFGFQPHNKPTQIENIGGKNLQVDPIVTGYNLTPKMKYYPGRPKHAGTAPQMFGTTVPAVTLPRVQPRNNYGFSLSRFTKGVYSWLEAKYGDGKNEQ